MNGYDAAEFYLGCYDGYHLLFAKHRLLGWDGDMLTSPTDLKRAHDRMADALQRLRTEMGVELRPNYVEAAQRIIDVEAENNDA